MTEYLTEKQEEEISALSTNCSCMTEVVRDMLLTAVESKIRQEQADFVRYQETLGVIISSEHYTPSQKDKSFIEGAVAEAIIEMDSYMALKKELKNIKICQG